MKIAAFLLAVLVCSFHAPSALAQAYGPTEPFAEKWQVGVAGSLVNPDYTNTAIPGFMVYGSYDPMKYLGFEVRTHFANKSGGEREFSLTGGYRFKVPIKGRIEPFVGGLVGFGHFSDGLAVAVGNGTNSLIISYVGGVDVRAAKHLNVRLEAESQTWTDFLPNGLVPVDISFGVAYHR